MVTLESRNFSLQIQKFENGYFISITEGTNKLGSMVASLGYGPNPVTTTIIPAKSDSLFLKLVAERISTKFRNIVLVSTYIQNNLDPSIAKGLMSEIIDLIEDDG